MFNGKITGNGRVFRNEIEAQVGKFFTYTIGFGSKRPDGGYDNASIDVRFKKDAEPTTWTVTNNAAYCEIEIVDAFLTFRQYENGGRKYTRWVVQVMEWKPKEK